MVLAMLQLLDGFAVRSHQVTVELPLAVQRLVALLALRGPSHRALVAGTLWPDVVESQALASLRTSVWRVGRVVPGMIQRDSSRVGLAPDVDVDVRAQETFACWVRTRGAEDPQSTRAGLDVLRPGPLLPGWYDDWVIFERERMNQIRLHGLEAAARTLVRHGDLGPALDLALEAVRADPLRESAHAVLITVYLAEGNVADAVHQYDVFSQYLWRDLGLVPSAALVGLLPGGLR